MRRLAAGVLAIFAAAQAAAARAQTSPPEPTKAAASKRASPKASAKPPLDFTGVWVLDEKQSRNISPPLRDAVLEVKQTGNHIWISPADPSKSALLAESIVADGRPYEKALGVKDKATGTLTVDWAKDGKALWLEMVAGPSDDPRRVVQRSVWKISADRKTWVRQSVSIHDGKTQQSLLVFRRREEKKPAPPTSRR